MAALDGAINTQLFHELKQQYPEIPDNIVSDFMRQHSNNKNKCLEVLSVESPKHMFGEYTTFSGSSSSPIVQQLTDISLMDSQNERQRSDSGSSMKSNASTGSLPCIGSGHVASLARAWPPSALNSDSASAAASSDSDLNSAGKTISPVSPDFGPFLMHSKSTGQIPNIDCSTQLCGKNMNDPVQDLGVLSGAQSFNTPKVLSNEVLGTENSAAGSASPQKRQNWNSPSAINVSHNNSNMYSAGQFTKDSSGVSAGHSYVPNSAAPSPQHLSQATIFIKNRWHENRNVINPVSLPKVAVQPQLRIQQSAASQQGSPIPVHHFISTQDQQTPVPTHHLPSSPNRTEDVQVQGIYQLAQTTSPHNHQSVQSPFRVQYNYPARVAQQVHVSVCPISPQSPVDYSTPSNPPSLIYQPTFTPPDVPVRRNVMPSPGVPTMNYPAQAMLEMPNYQTFTATLPQTSKAGSPYSPGHAPNVVSPSSSQNSLSSDGPPREGRLQGSGNQEESDYIKALLTHQHVRKDKLQKDLEKETKKLEQIRGQVTQMEKNMADNSSAYPTLEALAKLRDSNRKLLTEIQCMTREIDMFNQGRTPLGIWNSQDEPFFQHLDQGPSAPHQRLHHSNVYGPTQVTPSRMPQPNEPSSTNSIPSSRLVKPLPAVPPPVPDITRRVPPAPQPQPHSSSGDSEEGEQWSCSACTFLNHPALNKCECCEMPRVSLGSL